MSGKTDLTLIEMFLAVAMAAMAFVLILCLGVVIYAGLAWLLLLCVITLCGPVVPYTWGAIFAAAGLLWVARLILSPRRGKGK